MAAGKLTPFYIALASAAVLGGILIYRSARGPSTPTLSFETRLPVGGVGPRGVVIGSDSAPVELMEFSDFECPWCARYAVLQLPDIKQRLVASGRLRLRFIHYPLDMHRTTPLAHLAASCANEQGRFWEMHDALFENQQDWAAGNAARLFAQYAERIGLDQARYSSCFSEQRTWPQVLADKRFGDSLLPAASTPTFFLNGRQMSVAPTYDQLKRIVDSLAPPAGAPAAAAPRR